jgi:DNA-binding SARP family transcriptional activator
MKVMRPILRIRLLGEFFLEYDAELVTTVNTPRLQSLLAYLVLHRDAPQQRRYVAFLLWPDSTETQALTNLRNLLHRLRSAWPKADLFLSTERQTLQWRSDVPFGLDVADFETAVTRADGAQQAGDQAALRTALERAITFYEAALLPSCYDDWIVPIREGLHDSFISALERLVRLLENQRDYRAAVHCAQRLLRNDPLREATYRTLIRLHALSGDRPAALRAYHACVTVLQRELGVEPDRTTREAYERLILAEKRVVVSPTQRVAAPPLVGRDQEWQIALSAWRTTEPGQPHLLLLTGEAGIGKTRLAEELVEWATRQGIHTSSTRCYASGQGLPYVPVVNCLRGRPLPALDETWLSEVARLLPELLVAQPDLPRPAPMTESWQRLHLFEALTHALLGSRRSLLLHIDDLPSCDAHTLDWLQYLLHAHPHRAGSATFRARLLVVGTASSAGGGGGPAPSETRRRMEALLAERRRSGQLTEIELRPLSEAETLSLAAKLTGQELDSFLATSLYRTSEGNPLFVVEMVRAGHPGGATWSAEDGREKMDERLPPKVRQVIEARLAQLSPPAHELATVAATIGREFTFPVLARASGEDEETLVRSLDELWQRRIVRERGEEAYEFCHEKIRDVAYGQLSTARRRLQHRRVAEALEAVHADNLDPLKGPLAVHYEQAGLPERAIFYYGRAAAAAQRMYANEDALALYQRALALIDTAAPGEGWRETVMQLYEGLGNVSMFVGRTVEAREAFHRALTQLGENDPLAQARLQRCIGKTWLSQHHYQEAEHAFGLAETALEQALCEPNPAAWRGWVDIQLDRIQLHYFQNQMQAITALTDKTRPVVERYGDPQQRIYFLHSQVMLASGRERFVVSEGTLADTRALLAISEESGSLLELAAAQFWMGFSLLWHGDLHDAAESLETGLTLAEQTGDVTLQVRCLTYLTIAHRMRGNEEQARRRVSQSLAVAKRAKMPEYIGMAQASRAWLAWRAGDLSEAQERGQAALEIWQGQSTKPPFAWLALWPLIAVTLALLHALALEDAPQNEPEGSQALLQAQRQMAQAMDYARALLGPKQQRVPEALVILLEEALQRWDREQPQAAVACVERAMALAQELGYL